MVMTALQKSQQTKLAPTLVAIESIDGAIEHYKREAEMIVAAYWQWVEESNKQLRASKAIGENLKKRTAYMGPRVEYRPSGKYTKLVPNWVSYPYSEKRMNSPKNFKNGERIKLGVNKEYVLSKLLKTSVGWDGKKIIETEKLLMPIREQLEALHEAKVSLERRDTRIQRIANKYEESGNGE